MHPTIRCLTGLAAGLAVALSGGFAGAEDGDEVSREMKAQFSRRLFGAEPAIAANTYACFIRRYDAHHLARHPDQKVSAMKLLVTSEWMAEDKTLTRHFRLGVRFRDRRGDYQSSGGCGHFRPEEAREEIRLGCGVECDGGGFGMAMGDDDKSGTVRLKRLRIWQSKRSNHDGLSELVAGKDDATFRLDRTSLDECLSLVTDRKERTTMRRKLPRK